MKGSLDLCTIILTKNEEIHLRRCLDNALQFARQIFVVDSFSTDRTIEIAREMGVEVVQHVWENNHAKQFNWALRNLPIQTGWILRLDADEYLLPESIDELRGLLPNAPNDVSAFSLPRVRIFLGRRIRHGIPTIYLTRIFKRGVGRCEVRLMDEHIELSGGKVERMKHGIVDDNLCDLSFWTQKHVGYAVREAADLLDIELNLFGSAINDRDRLIEKQALKKRLKKHKYAEMPLFLRSFLYFCSRYFLRFGFLDGKEGFLWHFLQGWWYRTLVDAKVLEIKRACGTDREKILAMLKEHYSLSWE